MVAVAVVAINDADALLERIESARERSITDGGEGLTALTQQFLRDAGAELQPAVPGKPGNTYSCRDGTRVCCQDMMHWKRA